LSAVGFYFWLKLAAVDSTFMHRVDIAYTIKQATLQVETTGEKR